MEWEWLGMDPGEESSDPDQNPVQSLHQTNGRTSAPVPGEVSCLETACYHHDGSVCTFPWLERPTEEIMDGNRCRNALMKEGDTWHARVNALS